MRNVLIQLSKLVCVCSCVCLCVRHTVAPWF